MHIFDDGHKIKVKIKVNDGDYENEISENYFKSTFELGSEDEMMDNKELVKNKNDNKIMFAGSGEGCEWCFYLMKLSTRNLNIILKK